MELLELKTGKTVHVLLPRVAEGVFDVVTMFTKTDRHVIYYHTGARHVALNQENRVVLTRDEVSCREDILKQNHRKYRSQRASRTKPQNNSAFCFCVGHRTVSLFRTIDGKQIAKYQAHAEIKAISSAQGGCTLVLGAVDGSVVNLAIGGQFRSSISLVFCVWPGLLARERQ